MESTTVTAKRPERREVPVEQTWDLDGLYPDTAAWEADLDAVAGLLAAVTAYRGRLGDGAPAIVGCLRAHDLLRQTVHRVIWFASNRLAEDQGDPARQALRDRAMAMASRVGAATAFIEPELLALPEGTIDRHLATDPDLAIYRRLLTDILEDRAHTLSAEGESLLASLGEVFRAPYEIWQSATNADMRFDPVLDEAGRAVPMSLSALGRLLQSPDRRVRADAYGSAARAFDGHKRALAAAFAAAQKRDVVLARARRYPSALAAALAPIHLPETLFHTLLRVAEAGAGPFRRSMDLRRAALGVDRLLPCDLQAPLDRDLSLEIRFGDAYDTVIASLAPLGEEYRAVLEAARRERWVDWADNAGKSSGAYSSACYGYHPVILLNWQGNVGDTFTLAHELGHAVHSTFSTRAQPYVSSHYPLFLAEIASTTNELLLARHLLDTVDDPALRRYVLTRTLGSFNANFYGGAMLAALQLAVHQMVEQGRPLTYESVTAANEAILRRWYGDTLEITPEAAGNWTRPPHHFQNFYAYQYATGIAAAAAFADAILRDGSPAVASYLGFLRAGSSAHALDTLAAAGLDLTDPAPLERAVSVYDAFLRELEATGGSAV